VSPFTFVYAEDNNEILVGTPVDIAATTGQVPEQTFEDMEALMEKLHTFRSQEVIIALVSEDTELQKRWNESYAPENLG
jgi:hypothetical protein